MILPSKHVKVQQSLLGLAALLLTQLQSSDTVSSLWFRVSDNPNIGSFFRFTLALDLLFLMGALDLRSGKLRRPLPATAQREA